jgi:hypothetical protein
MFGDGDLNLHRRENLSSGFYYGFFKNESSLLKTTLQNAATNPFSEQESLSHFKPRDRRLKLILLKSCIDNCLSTCYLDAPVYYQQIYLNVKYILALY